MNHNLFKIKSIFCFSLFIIFLNTNSLFATEATISVSGNEGEITVTATATFTEYTECNPDDPTDCTTNDSGSLTVFLNGIELESINGESSVTLVTSIDGGAMIQGESILSANAIDCKGEEANTITQIIIDNTPSVSVTNPGLVAGTFDIAGAAVFNEFLGGLEGSVHIWIDDFFYGSKEYEGTNINWSFSGITEETLDAGIFSQGEHNVKVKAMAANNTCSEEVIETFMIDNTPSIAIIELGLVEGEFDINGTANFKLFNSGMEGSIQIWIDGILYGEKEYEGSNIDWSLSDITGQMLNADYFFYGEHQVTARAQSANGAISNSTNTFIIEGM